MSDHTDRVLLGWVGTENYAFTRLSTRNIRDDDLAHHPPRGRFFEYVPVDENFFWDFRPKWSRYTGYVSAGVSALLPVYSGEASYVIEGDNRSGLNFLTKDIMIPKHTDLEQDHLISTEEAKKILLVKFHKWIEECIPHWVWRTHMEQDTDEIYHAVTDAVVKHWAEKVFNFRHGGISVRLGQEASYFEFHLKMTTEIVDWVIKGMIEKPGRKLDYLIQRAIDNYHRLKDTLYFDAIPTIEVVERISENRTKIRITYTGPKGEGYAEKAIQVPGEPFPTEPNTVWKPVGNVEELVIQNDVACVIFYRESTDDEFERSWWVDVNADEETTESETLSGGNA